MEEHKVCSNQLSPIHEVHTSEGNILLGSVKQVPLLLCARFKSYIRNNIKKKNVCVIATVILKPFLNRISKLKVTVSAQTLVNISMVLLCYTVQSGGTGGHAK